MANQVLLSVDYIPNPSIGKALSLANIYVGIVDLDPKEVGNQKQISVLQENGTTVEVSQPISTSAGGVPLYNGSPVTILVDGSYSLRIDDSTGAQVYYVPQNPGGEEIETYNSLADLRAITKAPNDDQVVYLLGYWSKGDGGGGSFYWDGASTEADNNGSIIKADAITTGRLKWIEIDDILTIRFGVGLGQADDSEFIDDAIAATPEYGTLSFSNNTHNISEGFNIATSNITVNLNGATFKATTTFDQSTTKDPSMMLIGSTSPNVLVENVSIYGGGAIFDGRRDEQTGTPTGYSGIRIQPEDGDTELWRQNVKNVNIYDITITDTGFDGIYINGVLGLYIHNLKALRSYRLNSVIVDGEDIVFSDCDFSYCLGVITNSGAGVWNEPNETWATIKARYENCTARYNESSGFKLWNAGQSAVVDIEAINCSAEFNGWDIDLDTWKSTPGNGAFDVRNALSNPGFNVRLIGCSSKWNSNKGIQIITIAGTTTDGHIEITDHLSYNDNALEVASFNGSQIHVQNEGGYKIEINNPVVVHDNYGAGMFAIGCQTTSEDVFIRNHRVYGGFASTERTVYSNPPATRLVGGIRQSVLGADEDTGITTGDEFKSLPAIKPPSLNEVADPSADMLNGEMVVWTNAEKQIIIYKNTSGNPMYVDTSNKLIRATFALNVVVSAGTSQTFTTPAVGAILGDIVNVSATDSLKLMMMTGYVDSADNVTWVVYNPTASGHGINGFLIAKITDSN